MKLLPIIAAAAALIGVSAPASAAISVIAAIPGYQGTGAGFEGLGNAPLSTPYTEAGVTFNNIVGSVQVKSMPSDGDGAFPAGDTSTKYLSVLGGPSSVEVSFGSLVSKAGFYWGSIDTYNTVQFLKDGVVVDSIGGGAVTPTLVANGNQTSDLSNRYVTLISSGQQFDAIRISSTSNSFEFDNISAGVPEPSTWAMMMLGFAGLGFAGYRRANKVKAAA
jgi:hypothetical protein